MESKIVMLFLYKEETQEIIQILNKIKPYTLITPIIVDKKSIFQLSHNTKGIKLTNLPTFVLMEDNEITEISITRVDQVINYIRNIKN